MKTLNYKLLIGATLFAPFLFSQNPLFIPDTLSGDLDQQGVKQYNLTAQSGTTQFFNGINTPTFGYNGNLLGPTLIINKNDSIQLNVTNTLNQATTVHWHGFHVAPMNDGGPHQIILPNTTWNPSFVMRNEAATFWYHPHGEMKTEIQVSKGMAGMIIVRDEIESTYVLPRKYGIDDFPLIVQSKAFDVLTQIATATHEDTVNMVNGTINPFLNVPQQIVRFRLLNGNADRTYLFGLEDNSNFHIIGSDGGLLSAPVQTNRVRLSPGERMEILIDFSTYNQGSQINFKSFASELEHGIIGADSVGTSEIMIMEGYYTNFLNGVDFNVLQFNVVTQTPNPITSIPANFASKTPISETTVDVYRDIRLVPDTQFSTTQSLVDGPFFINDVAFHMDSINIVVNLNDTEIWTLTNETMVAHPFHIHDIEFFVLDINGNPPPTEYQGLKDVILVMPDDTVRFITKFTTFADEMTPYMYHCHLLHHEDEGMMGTFLVVDPAASISEKKQNSSIKLFPNPFDSELKIEVNENVSYELKITDLLGNLILTREVIGNSKLDLEFLKNGIYFLELKNGKEILVEKIIKN